jgi:hypothetical protein
LWLPGAALVVETQFKLQLLRTPEVEAALVGSARLLDCLLPQVLLTQLRLVQGVRADTELTKIRLTYRVLG